MTMLEFASAEELQAHYKAIRERINGAGKAYQRRSLPPPPPPAPEPEPAPVTPAEGAKPAAKIPFQPIDIDASFLSPFRVNGYRRVLPRSRVNEIVNWVAARRHVLPDDVIGTRRKIEHTLARQEALWLLYVLHHPHVSYPSVGMSFYDMDHTTVLHAVRRVQAKLIMHEEYRDWLGAPWEFVVACNDFIKPITIGCQRWI